MMQIRNTLNFKEKKRKINKPLKWFSDPEWRRLKGAAEAFSDPASVKCSGQKFLEIKNIILFQSVGVAEF